MFTFTLLITFNSVSLAWSTDPYATPPDPTSEAPVLQTPWKTPDQAIATQEQKTPQTRRISMREQIIDVERTIKTQERLNMADVNNDGEINILDLVLAGSHFGEKGANNPADVNGDEVVNIVDLVMIGSQFGQSSTQPIEDIISNSDDENTAVEQISSLGAVALEPIEILLNDPNTSDTDKQILINIISNIGSYRLHNDPESFQQANDILANFAASTDNSDLAVAALNTITSINLWGTMPETTQQVVQNIALDADNRYDESVRLAAVNTLLVGATDNAVDTLVAIYESNPNSKLGTEALFALGSYNFSHGDNPEAAAKALDTLLNAYPTITDPETRANLLYIIASYNNSKKTLPTLLLTLTDESAEVREAAADNLKSRLPEDVLGIDYLWDAQALEQVTGALVVALGDPDAEVGQIAAESLMSVIETRVALMAADFDSTQGLTTETFKDSYDLHDFLQAG